MATEKTAEELRREIAALQKQQWEITERLRDPRGIRRSVNGMGPSALQRKRGGRPMAELEDQPVGKRRLSSAVVKLEEGEIEENSNGPTGFNKDSYAETEENNKPRTSLQNNNRVMRDGNPRLKRIDYDVPAEPIPRVLPKNEDPSLVKRNRRMLGQLLGTLEKFREEDKQVSNSAAYMRRSDSLRRAEEKAKEESERLRQQEREQLTEKRRRDLTLRARVAAKAEQKKMELMFILWSEHHKKLSNFVRLFLLLVQCPI